MSTSPDLAKLIFGRLTWDAVPLHEPILLATSRWSRSAASRCWAR